MPEFVAKGHAWKQLNEKQKGEENQAKRRLQAGGANTKWNLNLNRNLYEINQFKFGLAAKQSAAVKDFG